MIHDPQLIDALSRLPTQTYSGDVFRATRRSLEPLTPSTSEGRWAPANGPAVLYTSMERDGALAEIAHHWSLLTPMPSGPAMIHRLRVQSERTLRLIRSDLDNLGVSQPEYDLPNYDRAQQIGAVVEFIGCDGLIVPSARWNCENLVLFTDNLAMDLKLEVQVSEQIDWQAWARSAGKLK